MFRNVVGVSEHWKCTICFWDFGFSLLTFKVDCVFIMIWSLHLVLLKVVEDPIPIHGGRLYLILYGLMSSVETKGFSISLTVSYFIFLRKRVEYPLGFKGRHKTEQASLTFCLSLEFLWNLMICDLIMPLKVWCGWNDLQWRSWCVSVGLKLFVV